MKGLSKIFEAIKLLEDAGLKLISTPRQLENGTLMFQDTKIKDVKYSISSSGYARRYVLADGMFGNGKMMTPYQLNKVNRTYKGWDHKNYDEISRVLKPGDYVGLAKDILRGVEKYRNRNWT